MGAMFDTIKRLYNEGKLTEVGLDNAVTKEWISPEEKIAIIGTEVPVEDPVE